MSRKTKRLLLFAAAQFILPAAVIALIIYKSYSARTGNDPLSMCVMHDLLHLYCPGCGGTRAVLCLARFDLFGALMYNPVVPYLAFVYIFLDVRAFFAILRGEWRLIYWNGALTWITAALPVLFFLLRNALLVFAGYDYIGDLARFWV